MYSPLFVCVFGPLCLSLFWYALLCVLSRVPIILKRKILFLLSHPCIAIFICSVALSHGAMGWSAVCDSGISWS